MKLKRVLVVDDEIFIRDLVKDFLEMEDIACDEAENSGDALKLIARNRYSLILLDWHLEMQKPADIVKEIKKKNHGVPIIMLTGDYQCSGDQLNEMGIEGVIYKPFKVDDFMDKINKFLEI
jgi:two-component system OmpR family response regulator